MSETCSDDSSTRMLTAYAGKNEKAPANGSGPHDLYMELDDPGATYANIKGPPLYARKDGKYALPLAQNCTPVKDTTRTEPTHPAVIATAPLCFRFPKDRQGALNYSPIEPGCWIYVFIDAHLWDELEAIEEDGQILLRRVNLLLHQGKPVRPATVAPEPLLHFPYTNASTQRRQIQIAVTHVQWSWSQILCYGGLSEADRRFVKTSAKVTKAEGMPAAKKRLQTIDFAPYYNARNGETTKFFSTPREQATRHLLSVEILAGELAKRVGDPLSITLWPFLQRCDTGAIALVLDDPIHVAAELKAEHESAVDMAHHLTAYMARGEYALATLVTGVLDANAKDKANLDTLTKQAQQKKVIYDAAREESERVRQIVTMKYAEGDLDDPGLGQRARKASDDRARALLDYDEALRREAAAKTPGTELFEKVDQAAIDKALKRWNIAAERADSKVPEKAAALISWLKDQEAAIPFEVAMLDFFAGAGDARYIEGVDHWILLLSELGGNATEREYVQEVMGEQHYVGKVFLDPKCKEKANLFIDTALGDGDSAANDGGGSTWQAPASSSPKSALQIASPITRVGSMSLGLALQKLGEATAKGGTEGAIQKVIAFLGGNKAIQRMDVQFTTMSVVEALDRSGGRGGRFVYKPPRQALATTKVAQITYKDRATLLRTRDINDGPVSAAMRNVMMAFELINLAAAI